MSHIRLDPALPIVTTKTDDAELERLLAEVAKIPARPIPDKPAAPPVPPAPAPEADPAEPQSDNNPR